MLISNEVYCNGQNDPYFYVSGPACSDTVEPIAGVSKHFRTGKESQNNVFKNHLKCFTFT